MGRMLLGVASGRLAGPHHQGNVGAVHIGVEQPHAASQIAQRDRQVDRDRGLAHASFAGTYGDQILNAGNRRLWRRLWTHQPDGNR